MKKPKDTDLCANCGHEYAYHEESPHGENDGLGCRRINSSHGSGVYAQTCRKLAKCRVHPFCGCKKFVPSIFSYEEAISKKFWDSTVVFFGKAKEKEARN